MQAPCRMRERRAFWSGANGDRQAGDSGHRGATDARGYTAACPVYRIRPVIRECSSIAKFAERIGQAGPSQVTRSDAGGAPAGPQEPTYGRIRGRRRGAHGRSGGDLARGKRATTRRPHPNVRKGGSYFACVRLAVFTLHGSTLRNQVTDEYEHRLWLLTYDARAAPA